jgi:hypothetical protein
MTSLRSRSHLLYVGPVLFALLSVAMGKKTGWDLFNYHWYNPYALLENRFGFDVAVGHHATYYNPLVDLPLYLVANHGPAWLSGVFSGAMAGISVALIGALAYCVLPITNSRHRIVAAIILALLGACGAGAWQEIGDPANDIPAAIGSFLALVLLASQVQILQDSTITIRTARILFVAGLCAGAAVGLKLTTAVYGFGLAAAVVTLSGSFKIRALRLSVFGAGGVLGVLLLGGFWMLRMWEFSGNPFFPYFNDIFKSPLLVSTGYLDPNFHPANWTTRLLFPFFFTANSHYVSESAFRDAHILAIYVLIPMSLLVSVFSRKRNRQSEDSPKTLSHIRLLFAFAGGSYLAWLVVFDVYRYLIPLEMLSPLLIALAIWLLPIGNKARIITTAITLVVLQGLVRVDLSDRQSWSGPYVKVDAPSLDEPDHTMILMTGHEAMAFVIPSFPRDIAFLRIDGWLVQASDRETGLARTMRTRVDTHVGPLFVLYSDKERPAALAALHSYSIALDTSRACSSVTSNIAEPLSLCPLTKLAQQSSNTHRESSVDVE